MVSQFDWFDIKPSYSYLCFGLLSQKHITTKTMIGCDGFSVGLV